MKYSIDVQHTNILEGDRLIIVDADGQKTITFGYAQVGEDNPVEHMVISSGDISESIASGYSTAAIAEALAIVLYKIGGGKWSAIAHGNTIDLSNGGLLILIWRGISGAIRIVADTPEERGQAVGFFDFARRYCLQPDWTFENAPAAVLLFVSLSVTQAGEARVASKRLGDLSITYSTNDVASDALSLLRPYCQFGFK